MTRPIFSKYLTYEPLQTVVDRYSIRNMHVDFNIPVPVAEWLRWWANLGVITTTELLGGCGFESHSRHE